MISKEEIAEEARLNYDNLTEIGKVRYEDGDRFDLPYSRPNLTRNEWIDLANAITEFHRENLKNKI